MTWLSVHWGTILVGLLVLVLIASVVYILRRDKAQGKSSCGAGCASCAMRGRCHGKQ